VAKGEHWELQPTRLRYSTSGITVNEARSYSKNFSIAGPDLEFRNSFAARLLDHCRIGLGDRLGSIMCVAAAAVRPAREGWPPSIPTWPMWTPVRMQLARHRLRQAAHGEFRHRERRPNWQGLERWPSAGDRIVRARSPSMRRAACWATRKAPKAVFERLADLSRERDRDDRARGRVGRIVDAHSIVPSIRVEQAGHLPSDPTRRSYASFPTRLPCSSASLATSLPRFAIHSLRAPAVAPARRTGRRRRRRSCDVVEPARSGCLPPAR